jgi:hypothetical protein
VLKVFCSIVVLSGLIAGCAGAPARYDYVKDGASAFEKENSVSECTYQIKLNKTAPAEQAHLRNLCMQGKGFRYKRVG